MNIIKNSVKCNLCGDIIESKTTHDMVWCKCGACAVDGGHMYLRRCYKTNVPCFTELSLTEEDKPEEEDPYEWKHTEQGLI